MRDLILNEATLRLGGTGQALVPNINSSRWDDEAWLNVNYADMWLPDVVSNNPRTILQKGHEQFQWWKGSEQVLEAAVVFADRPVKTELRFRLAHSGLSFAFQPALTEAEIADGFYRPDNVVGSFAVNHPKGGGKYRAGIFCHLYRWECIDALGRKEWCEPLRLDGEYLVIGLPVDWLKTATYPVTAMGAGDGNSTVGYSTGGSSSSTTNAAFCPKSISGGSLFYTAVTGDTIDTVSFFSNAALGTGTHDVGLYDVSSGNPNALVQSTSVTVFGSSPVATWFSTSGLGWSLTNGTTYALAIANKSGSTIPRSYYNTGASGDGRRNDSTTLPDPFAGYDISLVFSVYANIVAGSSFTPRMALLGVG